jgi:hypothetical protein
MNSELLPGFFQKDENIAIYTYHEHGLEELEKLRQVWISQGKPARLIGFIEGLMAVRATDPSRLVL